MTGIYKITNLCNGKMYVGQSSDIQHRWIMHKSELRCNHHGNKYLQNAWNKYGEDNFSFDVIEECPYDDLDEREEYWIRELNTYVNYENSNGYNLTVGGGGTKIYHPVLQFDLKGNFIAEWDSPRHASIETGIDIQGIQGSVSKSYKHGRGYIWIYKEDYVDKSSLDWYMDRKCYRTVLQYDRDANLVKTWDSLAEAERGTGWKNIVNCLLHNIYTTHGYVFVYEDEGIIVDKEYCDFAFTRINNICNHPFYQLDKDGNIVKRYNCLRESIEDGYNERMVNECCRELRDKYKGYLWCYVENIDKYTKEYCNEIINRKRTAVNYPILQYKDGVLVNRYERLRDLPKEYLKTNVADTCKGRKVQYKGYVWRYEIND